MLNLNSKNKRVTWRLADEVHTKLTFLSKRTELSIEELANLIIQNADMEALKPVIQQHRTQKKQAEAQRKRVTESLSGIDPSALDKLANMEPDKLEELLKNLNG